MRLQFGENSRMALETVRNNKVRSFLTVLGVVIGVGAMIFVASILVGLSRDVSAFLDDYGLDTFFIYRFDVGIRIGRMSAEDRARAPGSPSVSPSTPARRSPSSRRSPTLRPVPPRYFPASSRARSDANHR